MYWRYESRGIFKSEGTGALSLTIPLKNFARSLKQLKNAEQTLPALFLSATAI